MIRKMAIVTPAFTKKGNAKNVEKAKAAYEQLGWKVKQEFIGSLSVESYLIVEAEGELDHPKKSIVNKVKEVNVEQNEHDQRLSCIQGQITAIGLIDATFITSEINSLPDILTKDEQVLGAVGAIIDSNKWFIICTQTRILMLDKGMFRSQEKEIFIKDIDAIETKIGFMNGDIEIKSKANTLKITKALPADAEKFVKAVKQAMADAKSNEAAASNTQADNSDDIVSKLAKLSELKTAGVLTEEEFAEAKAKILE